MLMLELKVPVVIREVRGISSPRVYTECSLVGILINQPKCRTYERVYIFKITCKAT